MKILKNILLWMFGCLCGIVLIFILQKNKPTKIDIVIINNSSFTIQELSIIESRFKNSSLFKNIKPNDLINYSLNANGETTYRISARFDNTKSLDIKIYSEPGYRDSFIVLNDSIIYKTNIGY